MHYINLKEQNPKVSQKLTKKRPIRILQVVGGMNRGGLETWLMHVLRHIDRERFQIDFLVHTTESCAYDDEVCALGSKIIPCLDPSKPWVYARNFKSILREYGPYDIVHGQVYLFDGFVLRLAHQEKIPVKISHIHPLKDINDSNLLRPIYRGIMTRWISKYATHILSPSHSSLKSFQNICDCSKKHTHIVFNGVELKRFTTKVDTIAIRNKYGLPIDKPIVIYVARLVPHKNHEQMLRIAKLIKQNEIKAHFVIVGSHGELLEILKQQVEELPDVSLLVGVEDISSLLKSADLFFFPSLEEGFGVVAIEAAAAGLPVVATDLPTIREACSPNQQAFMFPPNDDKTAYGNILKILEDKQLKQQLSIDSKHWASNFSICKSVETLMSIYSNI